MKAVHHFKSDYLHERLRKQESDNDDEEEEIDCLSLQKRQESCIRPKDGYNVSRIYTDVEEESKQGNK